MAYPTTAELVAQSGVPELTSLTSAQQDGLRATAIASIESVTRQSFEPFVGTLLADGDGGRELWLPRRAEALTGIAVRGASLDLTDVAISSDGWRLLLAPLSTSYAVVAMRESPYDRRAFTGGPDAVALTGTFGWSVCPDPVAQAIRIDMEDQALADANQLAGTVASYRRLGITDISQGNLRVTLGPAATLSSRVEALLSDYVRPEPGYRV